MHTELIVVFLACDALILGALMRLFARRTGFPYTIAMLLLGIGAGLLIQVVRGEGQLHDVMAVLERGSHISPHAIILVFLPALVFESAFALDAHAFRRDLGAVSLLAVPAMLISTIAIGGLIYALTSFTWEWSFTASLVFGALISATDPVAVVAILRETGAPKRLSVLIEGESLLNDGTAIVVFTVLIGVLTTGGLADINAGQTALQFAKVVSGGVAVGVVLAWLAAQVIGRTFNDPMVEITLTIVVAYLSMIVAEELLHVSGVLAVVSAGLYMGGRGRTRISPEVAHFLHEFWEMLAYIANTLIFFLVGLVIAAQLEHLRWRDIGIVLITYVGMTLIRFAITFSFRPAIGLVGDPVSAREASLMSWGGLRGAVSLALALVVAQSGALAKADEMLGREMLTITAGVVLLTILVNGGTTAWLLDRLGFSTPPLTNQIADLSAEVAVLDGVASDIIEITRGRDLRTVSWAEVHADIDKRREGIHKRINATRTKLEAAVGNDRVAGYWQHSLAIERQAYWAAFGQGTLGANATMLLDQDIDAQLDRIGQGACSPPPTRTRQQSGIGARVRRWAERAPGFAGLQFDRLALLYDLARAQTLAAERVLAALEDLGEIDQGVLLQLQGTYRGYLHAGKELLEDLRANLPEVTEAIETRLARRIQLNLERDRIGKLAHRGILGAGAAEASLQRVEKEMKLLRGRPQRLQLPETADVCRATPLFAGLDDETLAELAEITKEEVLAPGELLFEEGDKGDSMYVVARGAVQVIKTIDSEERVLDILGGGDVLGEMSLLSGAPRNATIRAATTVTLGKVARADFDHIMEKHPHVHNHVWDAFAVHSFDNYTREHPDFCNVDTEVRRMWIAGRPHSDLSVGERHTVGAEHYVFIAVGEVEIDGELKRAPEMSAVGSDSQVLAKTMARIVMMPDR